MRAEQLHEALARDRKRYERLIYRRLYGGISWQDAEDIVSDALLRAHSTAASEQPEPGKEGAWFTRIVFNQGIDFLRARDGRKREGSRARPSLVSLTDLEAAGVDVPDDVPEGDAAEAWLDALDSEGERAKARTIVTRVLSRLSPKDAELIKLRHLLGAEAPREQVAAMAGLTLGEFRWRYARAWTRFVDAMAADQPSDQCRRIRLLLGAVEAEGSSTVAAEIDAHVLGCPSCRVFARDSYRALELLPFVPTVGLAERWAARLAAIWERSNPEVAAGGGAAAAAGAGAPGLTGAGGAAGGVKAVAALCGATAVTAGVCGTVLIGDDAPDRARRTPGLQRRAEPPVTRTTAQAPAKTRPIVRKASPGKSSSRRKNTTRTVVSTPKPEAPIPSPAPAGSQEFEPSGASAALTPASTPSSGGGEFTP
jgi:RNA polymerase sigma factor (sigma-70 family)